MARLTAALVSLSMPAVIGAGIFAAAGRVDLPFVWGVVAALAVFCVALVLGADAGMMDERVHPAGENRDRLGQRVASVLLVVHWVLAGLDVRFGWSPVPMGLRAAGLAGYAVALACLFVAMRANPFYSSVVRVQLDRGQRPVDTGPYRIVRHPGYAASLAAMLAGGLALGSWVAMLPLTVVFTVFARRTLLEDRLLLSDLPGYDAYARRVRYRLIPGVF
jgi:protein-S-isoprenylcysteine O-methyltransferase Ste14